MIALFFISSTGTTSFTNKSLGVTLDKQKANKKHVFTVCAYYTKNATYKVCHLLAFFFFFLSVKISCNSSSLHQRLPLEHTIHSNAEMTARIDRAGVIVLTVF